LAYAAAGEGVQKEDRRSVGIKKNSFVRRHKLQLIHEPEDVGEKNRKGHEQGVGDHVLGPFRTAEILHLNAWSSRK
jgi:hypothetical protein